MTEAYIFDAVRTPRGKGKKDGALYSVKPVQLVAGLLNALQARNGLDTSQVDDIVLGLSLIHIWARSSTSSPGNRR